MQLERSLDEARSELESAQREARLKEGLDRTRIGRLDDDVASLNVQLQSLVADKGQAESDLKAEAREVWTW